MQNIFFLHIFIPVEKDDKEKCHFPGMLSHHHDWHSIDDHSSIHLNKKGHSLKLRNETNGVGGVQESHATCHRVTDVKGDGTEVKVVAHVKQDW